MAPCKNQIGLAFLAACAVIASASPAFSDDGDDGGEIFLPGIMLPPSMDELLDDNDDPKPCCLPPEWQGNVTGQSGFSSGGRGDVGFDDEEDVDRRGRRRRSNFDQRTTTVFVDETNKRVAGRGACFNDTCVFVVLFGTNNTADTYLYKMGAQKCWHRKSNRATFQKQCIPANATFGGSAKIGPADKGLAVEIWNFRGRPHHNGSNHGGVFISGRAVVTPDRPNCFPVFFQNHGFARGGPRPHDPPSGRLEFESNRINLDVDEFGEPSRPGPRPGPRRGGGFMGSAYFSNVEPTIKEKAIFELPSYCNTTLIYGNTLVLGEDMDYPDLIDRFVTLG